MATGPCLKRLQRDFLALQANPVPCVRAVPDEANMLEWHYVIEGPPDTPYAGGVYHGLLRFPPEFPLKPPSIIMFTESGRFQPGARVCLTMSDYHPETWSPLWTVSTILSGLLSFMIEDEGAVGTVQATAEERRKLASKSLQENIKNPVFVKMFPDLAKGGSSKKAAAEEKPVAASTPATTATNKRGAKAAAKKEEDDDAEEKPAAKKTRTAPAPAAPAAAKAEKEETKPATRRRRG